MKINYKHLTLSLISVLAAIGLSSCSSLFSSSMPAGTGSMQQTYNEAINGSSASSSNLDSVRERIRYASTSNKLHLNAIASDGNPIDSQFARLPNPNIVMYVYPHQAGTGDDVTPVPGYSTIFPLFQHVQYAMPGDVIAY